MIVLALALIVPALALIRPIVLFCPLRFKVVFIFLVNTSALCLHSNILFSLGAKSYVVAVAADNKDCLVKDVVDISQKKTQPTHFLLSPYIIVYCL